jgi:hypothetical protein
MRCHRAADRMRLQRVVDHMRLRAAVVDHIPRLRPTVAAAEVVAVASISRAELPIQPQ